MPRARCPGDVSPAAVTAPFLWLRSSGPLGARHACLSRSTARRRCSEEDRCSEDGPTNKAGLKMPMPILICLGGLCLCIRIRLLQLRASHDDLRRALRRSDWRESAKLSIRARFRSRGWRWVKWEQDLSSQGPFGRLDKAPIHHLSL